MYAWIWRRLPGNVAAKLVGALLLVAAVVVVLFLVVFPWAGPKLPFSHVTVDPPTSRHTSVPASPPAVPPRMT
jgi:hypothetical protein